MVTVKQALQAKEQLAETLRGLPWVNGVGVTWDEAGEPCVRVNVDLEIDGSDWGQIPSRVNGVPVLVQPMGPIAME